MVNGRRERGSAALTIGLALPALIGMVALGAESAFLLGLRQPSPEQPRGAEKGQ